MHSASAFLPQHYPLFVMSRPYGKPGDGTVDRVVGWYVTPEGDVGPVTNAGLLEVHGGDTLTAFYDTEDEGWAAVEADTQGV